MMTENDSSQSETSGKSHAQQAPGGGSSRGPEFGTGGEPQVPVPPYNELRSENTGRGAEATAKAFDASHAPEPGPPPPVSDEERDGVTGTETDPEPALGVGVSRGGRAEDLAPDRSDTDTRGAGRPAGAAHEQPSDAAGGDAY
jgi:hypothetical protein